MEQVRARHEARPGPGRSRSVHRRPAPARRSPGRGAEADARRPRRSASPCRRARPGEPPFEGPLDLLLHLVKEHQVDIFDIPIARITETYLAALKAMQELDIDVAGEFLHMAAQLMLVKSKLLLPRTEVAEDADPAEEQGDPRAELVRRLLEYQKYRAAAEELGRHDILDRDVFARRARAPRLPQPDGPDGLAEVSVFQLIEALDRALANARPESRHEVEADRLSITDAISRVAEVLRLRRRVSFVELLLGRRRRSGRSAVIATFLAILEMAKLRLLRIFQAPPDEDGAGGGDPGRGARDAGRRAPRARKGWRSTDERDPGARPHAPRSCRPCRRPRRPRPTRPSTRWSRPPSRSPRAPERRSPSRSWPPQARRLSPERARTVVEALLFLAEKPAHRRGDPAGDRARAGARSRKALDELSGHFREGVSGHRAARGGRRLAAAHLARRLRLRPPLPPGEAAAAHPRRAGDAGHRRLPAAGDPPRGGGDPRAWTPAR